MKNQFHENINRNKRRRKVKTFKRNARILLLN